MPDLHGWITQQIDALERSIRDVDKEHQRDWITQWNASSDTFAIYDSNGSAVAFDALPVAAGLIARHDPAAVLRRCAADRKILAEHRPVAGDWTDHYACEGCGYDGSYCPERVTEHVNDCPTLLALAEGYGLTEEQRAGLDRPVKERPLGKPGSLGMPDALVESVVRASMAAVPVSSRGPNWKGAEEQP